MVENETGATRSSAVQRKTEGDLSKTRDCVSSAPDKHSVQTRTIQDELQPSVTPCAGKAAILIL